MTTPTPRSQSPRSLSPRRSTSFRPRLIEGNDPLFLGSLSFWTVVGCIVVRSALAAPPPVSVPPAIDVEARPSVQIAGDYFTKPPEPVIVEPAEHDAPAASDADTNKRAKKKAKKKTGRKKNRKKNTTGDQTREERAPTSALLDGLRPPIGTTGERNSGRSVFDPNDAGQKELDAALARMKPLTASAEDGGMRRLAHTGGRGDFGIGDLDRSDVGSSQVDQVEVRRKTRASVTPPRTMAEHADEISQVVRRKAVQIRTCYERSLKTDPTLGGRLVADLEIENGRVTHVSITEGLGDSELSGCVEKKISRWTFPSEVSQPIVLPFALSAS